MGDLLSLAAAEEAQGRRRQMLRTAFGPTIAAALADPSVIEVMVNPDGKLWIERATVGRQDTGERIGSAEAERIIRLVAAHVRREVTDKTPIVSAELPETGERFEGVMPPVSPAPCFAVRKPADVLYRLADYVAARIMSVRQAEVLAIAVRERKNILVVGGTSSGKTTLVNALLAEIADLGERVVILEDTRELKCAAADCVALRTKPGVATLARSGALDAAAAARPHHRRRGARAGSARHAQGVEHRASRRHHHRARQLRAGGPPSARAARAGSRRHRAARSDRAGHRPRGVHRRPRRQPPRRDAARGGEASMPTATTSSSRSGGQPCTPCDGANNVNPTPMLLTLLRTTAAGWVVAVVAVIITDTANAAGSGMPWEAPLQRILESIEGPVAKVVAVVIIIVTGLSLAFGDMGGGLRRLIQIVFGLSIAFAATSFFLSFFSFAGGALIN